ncbi:MAG: hypothetical protein ACR2FU_20310 [Streptosporangiaceae bacterium]
MSRQANRPVSRSYSRSEADRLGKRGSYRLGGLSSPVGWPPSPPRPLRPSFDRPQHRGPAVAWLLAAAGATAAVAVAAVAGLWFMPFVIGVLAGLAVRWGGWRLRVTGPAMVLIAAAGWGTALWIAALRGMPVGATARVIAAMSGLPAVAALIVAITLAVSGGLGLAGLWLGRAVAPRLPQD